MPNWCNYEMKIKGSKNAIERVIECLKAHYDYGEGKPSHKHFFRNAEIYFEETSKVSEDTYICHIASECAWSVYSCMCEGEHTYYNSFKKEYAKIFMGTTLKEQSEDCEIEVFSEEEGMVFSEHLLFKNGKCLINTSKDLETIMVDFNGNVVEEVNDDNEDDIDWDSTRVLNPNRENKTEDYLWTI